MALAQAGLAVESVVVGIAVAAVVLEIVQAVASMVLMVPFGMDMAGFAEWRVVEMIAGVREMFAAACLSVERGGIAEERKVVSDAEEELRRLVHVPAAPVVGFAAQSAQR